MVGIPRPVTATLGLPERVHVCLFDLDGVLTDTASVHRKEMFDAYLNARAQSSGDRFVPFDIDEDYRTYVDGKKRQDGVRSFLDSRGITQTDEEIEDLGNRKNEIVLAMIREPPHQGAPAGRLRVPTLDLRTCQSENSPQVRHDIHGNRDDQHTVR